MFIALPTFALIPALPLGLLVWLFGRTGKVMVLANLPIALLTGWLFGSALTQTSGEISRWDLVIAVGVALLCSVMGILGGWWLVAPRLRTPKGVTA